MSDQDIQAALRDRRLVIDPEPASTAYDTMSVDLRLGDRFFGWSFEELRRRFGEVPPIRLGGYEYTELASAYLREIHTDSDGCVVIQPGAFLLAATLETVGFPADGRLAGRVEGKSSLARLGLSVHFAPTLHTTWQGPITLELHNVGEAPLKIGPGDPICQLIVEEVSNVPDGTMEGTRFHGQRTPAGGPGE